MLYILETCMILETVDALVVCQLQNETFCSYILVLYRKWFTGKHI